MKLNKEINNLISNFDGNVSLYAVDGYNNEVKFNENRIVETARCIKVFILVEYYFQILNNKKSRDDILVYDKKNDYVENGSGIIQYLDNLSLTSKNMANLMIIVSDNIATDKMIEYLGIDNINNTIKELGFVNTKLVAEKLDFKLYNVVGKTTAYEYSKIYSMLLKKEILTSDLCDEIIKILSNQQYNQMLVRFLSPKYLEEKGSTGAFINFIASKSGSLGDEGRDDIINCRNDGGIISTKCGDYIVSIFISDFIDHYFYSDNPAILLGANISKILFETFEKNNGRFE